LIYNATGGAEVPQGVVDGVVGFGDGVFSSITFGFGDLNEVRNAIGVSNAANRCSGIYRAAHFAGAIQGGIALGGAGAGYLSKLADVRRSYQSGLAAARAANLTPFQAWGARRMLGSTLKESTPWLARQWIYLRNLRTYGDRLGPAWDPARMTSAARTLTDTNKYLDTLTLLPRSLPELGAIAGGGVAAAMTASGDCGCQ
ncbi:MAG: hypothetical protein ACOVN2_13680, partial [Usitatibacteraceae bacterium]